MPFSTPVAGPKRVALLVGLSLLGGTQAHAQRVAPDPAFGTSGSVATGLTPGWSFNFSENDAPGTLKWSIIGQMLVLPDGKILACGTDANRWTVRRYNADGTPDTSFGTNGSVTTTFPGTTAVAQGMALQPDGKLVVVGSIPGIIGNVWAVARYDARGALDPTFGTGGRSFPDPQNTSPSELTRLVVLPDGRLLAAASYERSSSTRLLRLLPNGQPDNTYGTGPLAGSFTGPTYMGMFQDLIQQPDGKVLLTTSNATSDNSGSAPVTSARIARYNAAGTPDNSFGTNGETSIVGFSVRTGRETQTVHTAVHGIALQPDGKILLAGHLNNGLGIGSMVSSPALFRLNANGSPDAAFNTAVAGSLRQTGGLAAVVVQRDGRIVVGGSVKLAFAPTQSLLLARYSATGVLDTSFGSAPPGVYAASVNGGVIRSLTTMPNDQLLAWETINGSTTNGATMRLTRYTTAQSLAVSSSRPTPLQLQASPVPASGPLRLRYTLPTAAPVRALVHDPLGRLVVPASETRQVAGPQELTLDLQTLAAGSYFVTLEAGGFRQTARVVVAY